MDKIIKRVLKKITPSKIEERNIAAVINFSKEKLNKELKRFEIDAETFVGGSIAKGTWLKDQHDIDFFVKFDLKYKNKDIGKLLYKPIKSAFRNFKLIHGSRDYYKVNLRNYELEFVPVLGINNPEEAKNSIDVSLFHVNYIKKKISRNKDILNEIRVFKSFAKAQGIYGAESYISGLSGYVTELLMIYFKKFKNLVKKAEEIVPPIYIDIESYYKSKDEIIKVLGRQKMKSPIILIDPVLKTRNAAAALDYQTFSKLIFSLRMFYRKPSIKYFTERKETIKDIKKKSVERGTLLFTKEIKKRYPEDIFFAKLKKCMKKIFNELKSNGIYTYSFGYINYKEKVKVYFEIGTLKLPKKKKHYGPPVWIGKKHFDAFIKKWRKVYVEGNFLVCDINVKNVKEIVTKILKKRLRDLC